MYYVVLHNVPVIVNNMQRVVDYVKPSQSWSFKIHLSVGMVVRRFINLAKISCQGIR